MTLITRIKAFINKTKVFTKKTWGSFIKCMKICIYASDGSLSWPIRIIILVGSIVVAATVTYGLTEKITTWLREVTHENIQGTHFISPALFIFGFVFSLGTWMVRTHDRKKEFKDSLQTQKDSLQTRNETLFQNAVEMVLNGKPLAKRVLALCQLASLKHRDAIENEQIDQITDSGLKLCTRDVEGKVKQPANLFGVDLSHVVLFAIDFENANLENANLQSTHLHNANLQGGNLQGANLKNAYLQGANLKDANLEDATLQLAHLQSANLQDANLQGVELKDSIYDSKTIFPAGFDPKQHGMRKQP